MKALVVTESHHLELRDISKPVCGEYDALVKMRACGICATTDREIIEGIQPFHNQYPCVLGHEGIGEVIEIGKKVRTFKLGDLVTRPVAIWPGTNRDGHFSGWGGYAEYGFVRDHKAMSMNGNSSLAKDYTALRENVVPEGMSVKQACAAVSLAETASWTWNLPSLAHKNIVIAGTGSAGLSLSLWCKFGQAKNILVLGRRKERLDLAKKFGADHGVLVTKGDTLSQIREVLDGKIDLFIEAAGAKSNLPLGGQLISPRGAFALYGVFQGMKEAIASFKSSHPDISFLQHSAQEHLAYSWTCDMIRRKLIPVDDFMTHSFGIQDYQRAFQALETGEVVKGMLTMDGKSS